MAKPKPLVPPPPPISLRLDNKTYDWVVAQSLPGESAGQTIKRILMGMVNEK